jgi:hypothetical protein
MLLSIRAISITIMSDKEAEQDEMKDETHDLEDEEKDESEDVDKEEV